MSTSAISKRYAKALVSLGSEQNKVEDFGQQLADLSGVVESEDQLRLLIESPTLSPEKKAGILGEIMDKLDRLADLNWRGIGLEACDEVQKIVTFEPKRFAAVHGRNLQVTISVAQLADPKLQVFFGIDVTAQPDIDDGHKTLTPAARRAQFRCRRRASHESLLACGP